MKCKHCGSTMESFREGQVYRHLDEDTEYIVLRATRNVRIGMKQEEAKYLLFNLKTFRVDGSPSDYWEDTLSNGKLEFIGWVSIAKLRELILEEVD